MIIPGGLENRVPADRVGEQHFSPAHDLADFAERNATIYFGYERRLPARYGKKEFVIFPAIQREVQSIGGAQLFAGRSTGDTLRPDARPTRTGKALSGASGTPNSQVQAAR